jgi:hypothetical protein
MSDQNRLIREAIVAVSLGFTLLNAPAFAQSADRSDYYASMTNPHPELPGFSKISRSDNRLPLDAMLHHQPRAGDVARREGETGNNDQDLRREKEELDALYNEIMARSAPVTAPGAQ